MMEKTIKRASLATALALFIIYFANVAFSRSGQPLLLGDIAEAVTLFIAMAFFVVGILLAEREVDR